MDLQNYKASFLSYGRLDLLILGMPFIREVKLVHVVLLLYFALERYSHGSCKSDKRAAKLHLAFQQQPLLLLDEHAH